MIKKNDIIRVNGIKIRENDSEEEIKDLAKSIVGQYGKVIVVDRDMISIEFEERYFNKYFPWLYSDEVEVLSKGEKMLYMIGGSEAIEK